MLVVQDGLQWGSTCLPCKKPWVKSLAVLQQTENQTNPNNNKLLRNLNPNQIKCLIITKLYFVTGLESPGGLSEEASHDCASLAPCLCLSLTCASFPLCLLLSRYCFLSSCSNANDFILFSDFNSFLTLTNYFLFRLHLKILSRYVPRRHHSKYFLQKDDCLIFFSFEYLRTLEPKLALLLQLLQDLFIKAH